MKYKKTIVGIIVAKLAFIGLIAFDFLTEESCSNREVEVSMKSEDDGEMFKSSFYKPNANVSYEIKIGNYTPHISDVVGIENCAEISCSNFNNKCHIDHTEMMKKINEDLGFNFYILPEIEKNELTRLYYEVFNSCVTLSNIEDKENLLKNNKATYLASKIGTIENYKQMGFDSPTFALVGYEYSPVIQQGDSCAVHSAFRAHRFYESNHKKN